MEKVSLHWLSWLLLTYAIHSRKKGGFFQECNRFAISSSFLIPHPNNYQLFFFFLVNNVWSFREYGLPLSGY